MDSCTIQQLETAAEILTDIGHSDIADLITVEVKKNRSSQKLADEMVDIYYSYCEPDDGMRAVLDLLRGKGWIEPYEIPVSEYDEWDSWELVPVGVKVFDHSIASTNSDGEHCAWQKKEDGTVLFWVSSNPTTPTVSGLSEEYRSSLGPFVRAEANG